MGTVSFSVLAIDSYASITMRRASVIQAIMQTVQLPKKVHRDVMTVQVLTHVTDSSRCVEYIINLLQYQKKHVKAIKIEDCMKLINGSQRMKLGSTKLSDQCLPIGR
jgi:hypothetical protein